MLKNSALLGLIFLILTGCQKEDVQPSSSSVPESAKLNLAQPIEDINGKAPMTRQELNQEVIQYLQRQGVVQWSDFSDYEVWSAALASDSVFSIGYAPEGYGSVEADIHLIDVEKQEWKSVKNALINFIEEETRARYPEMNLNREDLLVFGDKPLPYFNVRIWDYEILANIRNFTVTRYAEPMGFGFEESTGPLRSSSGCDNSSVANPNSNDFFTAPQGPRVSWNFIDMKIHQAWFNSNRGAGVTLGVIDTGISSDQAKLNDDFTGGFSGNRYVERYGFHEPCFLFVFCENDGVDDLCGHGTNMAATAVAPANPDGSFAGVAFKSNLISARATEDVIHNSSAEKNGVSDAYIFMGDRNDLDIISMSLGDLFSSGQITDAINYAYNQGKMIFNAAGTSLSFTTFVGVIFPANLDNTIAVTGIKTGGPMEKCTTCHSGSQVDFVVTMEDRNNENRTPLTLSTVGNDPEYTGGSSVATATAAGIAAMVWSNDLNQTREEVLEKLKSASNFYPSRDSEFGWGKINAKTAVQLVN